MKITTNVQIDAGDFASGLSYDNALKFIKVIDVEQQQWSFTYNCAKYFIEQTIAGAGTDVALSARAQGHLSLQELKEMLK